MEDEAQKITKRLYGDDKVKYEIILNILYFIQKLDGNINNYLKGNSDGWIMGLVENLEGIVHKRVRVFATCMSKSEFKKLCECNEAPVSRRLIPFKRTF